MKRLFHIALFCACALFGFVSNAEAQAQAPDGTYVTISYTYNRTTYYLAVDNGAVATTDTYGDNCVWIRTSTTNTTAFWSVTAEKYLSITTGNSPALTLQPTEKPFTYNSNQLYFLDGKRYYYITFSTSTNSKKFGGARTNNNAKPPTNGAIIIDKSSYTPTYKFTSATPNKTSVTASELKEIRVSTNDEIGSIADESKITLTNATIDNIKVENNQLVIATKAPYADGECTLTILEGAVVGTDNVAFAEFKTSWKISPYTFTSVTPEEGDAGSFSVITLTADVAIKQAPTSGFTLGTKTIGNGLTVTLSNDKKQLTITSNTILNEGTHTLYITEDAVVAEDGIAFAEAEYSWKVLPPQFIDVTPATGTTNGFNTIILTASADIEEELRFGYYQQENNAKVLFKFNETETSKPTQGLTIKRLDARTLEITIPDNLGEGTYELTIEQGAIQSKDGIDFAKATYTWTVNAHQFDAVQPSTLDVGKRLEKITIPAADPSVAMSIPHDPDQIADWIALTNAGGAVIPTTVAIVNNELVITPVAALGNGTYTLDVKKGAVVGPHSVPFVATSKTWNVVVSVSITHVKGFYSALGAGGYQNVHTVERTIYYDNTTTSIPLTLAETNFFGYMRWYDHATDGGEDITWLNNTPPSGSGGNFIEITGTTRHLGWFGWNRSKTTGNPVADGGKGGVLSDTENSNKTPTINISGWTGSRTIACDVSHYLDYTVTRIDENIVGVTEPRLSYRQLFHFKPASEMADKFKALEADEYLEEYTYTAPTGTNVYLSTEFRYNGDNAENCYFYYDGGQIKRVTTATWSTGVTWSAPYGVVSSTTEGTKTYTLTANNGELRIAKFTVTYVDKAKYGPVQETGTNGSAKALMSYAEMNAKFDVLEYNNFSFGQKPNGSAQQYLTTTLPYDQSTYGFSHMAADAIKPNDEFSLPYYGEYAIVNRIGDDYWEESANHVDGGATVDQAAAQGFGIYVDGTTKPGVVASISTKVTICAERTMYCSVWLRNPRPSGQCGTSVYKPIFRCNVQGRNQLSNGEYTPWEDVGVYFVGEIPCASGWQQVNFPIKSQETYSECRVQIYNFGTGGNGNDFWLDDLCIYADKLPMSSYQLQTEMCCSPDHDGTTFTAAVLRVDYGATTISSTGYQYYQIYNKTTGKPFVLTSTSLSPYYDENKNFTADGLTKEQYGSIEIMAYNYNPTEKEIRNNPSDLVGELLNAYHLDTNDPKTAPLCGKCFVAKRQEEITTESKGNYYMYVVHIIPNIRSNRIEENYLQEHCQYTLRMTSEASDLLSPALSCAVEIDLPATQESLYRLMSDQIETTEFLCNSTNNCPNEQYTIEAFIRKDSDPYSDAGKAEGTYLADWMYGHAFDDVYRMDYPHDNDAQEHAAKDAADIKFEEVYHCSRAQVTDAFLDLRRLDEGNTNYGAETFGQIDPTKFSDYDKGESKEYASKSKHYETLKYLHKQGWLQLATSSVSFYLGSQDIARYWVFPIENSAKATDGKTPLHDCPEPRWVQVSTKHSNHYVNLAPGLDIHDADDLSADPRYGNIFPNARVLARMVNNTIQIPIHQSSQDEYDVHFMGADAYLFQTNDENITNPTAVKYIARKSNNTIVLMPATSNNTTLEIGKEYTMCIRMRDNKDQHRAAGDNCDVGKVYVKLLILPDIVTWTPTTPDKSWHNDANWTGYGTGMENYHYAPIAGSSVIIPADQHPELTAIASDPHPYPMDANFALTPTCGQIYFQPGAMMLNQHLLQHDKALVDLVVPNQTWNTVAVPIASIVSGDMYIPHTGDENDGAIVAETEPFTVGSFQGARHSKSAFPFWISVYNKTVQRVNENPDKTGTTISTNTQVFASTNALDEPMLVGSGYQLLGYGPRNFGADDPLTIRLPKPDNIYSYYDAEGVLGQKVAIDRGANPNKLTYSPDVPVTLKNEVSSNSFMFGNPTMAKIDLTKCLPAGSTIYKMVNDGWVSGTPVSLEKDEEYRYLEPMRSVLVTLPTPGKTAEIDLKAEYLTTPEKIAEAKANNIAPRRNASSNTLQLMTIYADVYGTKARCLVGAKSGMADTYALGEDALFISSGVEAEVNSATATSPVNMYTVSDNIPLMVDIRENIDTIPMALLIQDYYRTDKFTLTFHLTENWEKECYFCDALTGTKTLITDSLTLEVEMPLNHATRYFITGPDQTTNSGVVTNTTNPDVAPLQVWAYSEQAGEITVRSNDIIQSVTVYDIAGHIIARQTLDLLYNQVSLPVGQGVHIAEVTLRDNSKHYTRAIVP
ncbi:MAG: hypothetical protein IKW35_05095 [Paludibacteraceae bacterium]|nr:hypothetical protein [Paludibacteraceae bacterium]